MWYAGAAWAGDAWPPLSDPPAVGGGEADAALVVGIGDYLLAPDVPGADVNARDWYTWFTRGRRVPADRVKLLLDAAATRESVLAAAGELRPAAGGTAWVVFVGHGAPSRDGHDGLLLGADAQQTAVSVEARSVSRTELLRAATGGGGPAVVVLDACFSGKDASGAALLPGLQPMVPAYATAAGPEAVLSAGGPDQFAGPLPGLDRPAFSYLVLGALQGWGDADRDGVVTASEAVAYADRALRATVTDRVQEPGRSGEDRVLSPAGRRSGPDLAALRLNAPAPRILRAPTLPSFVPGDGLGVDVEVEAAWATALDVARKPLARPESVRRSWCHVAGLRDGDHAYGEPSRAACAEWTSFVSETTAAAATFERDYGQLRELLRLPTVDVGRKAAAAEAVAARYEGFVGGRPMARRVRRAGERLEAGHEAHLAKWQDPLPHELRGVEHGPFYLPWDPLLVRFPILAFSIGAGREADRWGAIVGAYAIQVGPLDLGLLEANSLGGGLGWRLRAGVAPFAVRTSRRHPGEVRGSLLNPALGVAFQSGSRSVCCAEQTPLAATSDPPPYDVTASFLDGYVADTAFLTNGLGLRGELRLPLAGLSEGAGVADPAPQWGVSLVLNTAVLSW